MASVADLAALQELEERLALYAARLREIKALLGDPAELVAARGQAQAAEEALSELRRKQRALEADAAVVRAKRTAEQDKLYGGTVASARELVNLESEGKALARRLAVLDDEVLTAMLDVEQAAQARQEKVDRVARLQAGFEEQSAQLLSEGQTLQAEAVRLQAAVAQAQSRLPAEQLTRYASLKARKGGRAIARLRRGTCQACGVQVPTHVVQRAQQGGDQVGCPSCGRLLCPE